MFSLPESHPARTYRHPRSTRVWAVVQAGVYAAFIGLGMAIFVTEPGWMGPLCVAVFGAFLGGALWTLARVFGTRVDVGYDWVRVRTPFRSRTVRFAEVTRFAEVRSNARSARQAWEFRLHVPDGPPLAFTTRIEGWAAIVEALHQSILWRVPAAASLRARRFKGAPVPDPFDAAMSAAGQPIPEERASARRARWSDAVLAVSAVLAVLFPAGVAAAVALIRAYGRREAVAFVAIAAILGGTKLLAPRVAAAIRARRLRRARRDAVASAFDAADYYPSVPRPNP
jgi:hypothetical protein